MAQLVKNPPAMWETWVWSLGWEDPLEKGKAAAAAKSLQSCLTLQPHGLQPTRLPYPWDSPGKNTGVGCHFLLQCMKVKSESEVPQSHPALHNPMDCSLPGSSVHGIFQTRGLEWGAIAFSELYVQDIIICAFLTFFLNSLYQFCTNYINLFEIPLSVSVHSLYCMFVSF